MNACLRMSAALAAAMLFAIPVSQAATIMPTGGALNAIASPGTPTGEADGETTPVGAGYGFFMASALARDERLTLEGLVYDTVATAEIEATLSAGSWSLSAVVDAMSYENYVTYGWGAASVSGQLGFEVTEAGALWFDWQHVGGILGSGTTATLTNGVDTLVSCRGDLGCNAGSSHFDGRGRLDLAPGFYELSFETTTEHAAGLTFGNSFALSLTPVPLPAGLTLMVSGLGALLALRRRITAAPRLLLS